MKQEIPQIGTKEFNDLASAYFGGKPKQEALEEAKYNAYKEYWNENHTQEVKSNFLTAFELGAKWQEERMYSEEEVHNILDSNDSRDWSSENDLDYWEWFEQFKKK